MSLKKIFIQIQERGIVTISLVSVACFLILLMILRFAERPTKSFCEYILKEDRAQSLNQADRVLSVEVAIAEMKPMTKRIGTTGNLKANASIMFKAEMPGGQAKIKKIHFEQGTAVKKDDLLLEFEDADFKARYARAKAEFDVKKLEFDRISTLYNQKIESQKKYDEASAGVSVAKAQLEEAEANLKKTQIIAPFDGMAGILDFSEGATVQSNQDLFKLVDETPMKVEFSIPERYIHDVGVGQELQVKVDVFKDRIFSGRIEAVDSAITTETHSLSVRGSIPNESGLLRQGLFCNLEVLTGEQGDILQIPETAVHLSQDREVVFVVEKGRAMVAPVITGYRENGKVEIRSGLRSGHIVITAGQVKFGGEKIKITNLPEDLLSLQVAKASGVNDPEIKDSKDEVIKEIPENKTKDDEETAGVKTTAVIDAKEKDNS